MKLIMLILVILKSIKNKNPNTSGWDFIVLTTNCMGHIQENLQCFVLLMRVFADFGYD